MQNRNITSVTASVPASVRTFEWNRNHHTVTLTDEDGGSVKLHAGGLLRGECTSCRSVVFATTHAGAMICPHCLAAVKWQWAKLQLAFLPEHESQFMGFDAPQVDSKPLTVMQRAWLVMYTAITRKAPKPSSAPSAEKAEHVPGVGGLPVHEADEETTDPGIAPRDGAE